MRNACVRVEEKNAGTRLDRFLAERFPDFSRSRLKGLIEEGYCRLDGEIVTRADVRLKAESLITLSLPEQKGVLTAEDGPVEIVYRDEHLCVINKPCGLTVHPCPSCQESTLIQRLLTPFPELARMEGERPGVVHRIDKDTSGLLVVALTEECRLRLCELFAGRAVEKEYLALVAGVPPKEGHLEEAIGRDPKVKTRMAVLPERMGGRPALTQWQVLWSAPSGKSSLLSVRIHTGRTHQIRVHMAYLGHPLLGDKVYAEASVAEMAPRQMLHAFQLAFVHPYTGKKLSFVSPPPEDFRTCAFASAHTLQKVVITGNPGSGKSTVSNFFRSRGVPCFSADEEVAALYQPESEVALWLAGHGGSHLLDCTGGIDRAALFAAFQKDRHFKQELESVLHAWVFAGLERFFARHSARDLVVAEIPLYFECEKASEGLVSVCVFCPRAIRFARLAATRGWSAEKSAQIESWQWPEEQKKRASTLVLENSGDQQKLAEACAQLWERLRELRLADKERDQKKILSFFEDKTK